MTISMFNHDVLNHCLLHGIVPISYTNENIEIATTQEKSTTATTTLKLLCHQHIKVLIWSQNEIDKALQKIHFERQNTFLSPQKSAAKEDQNLINFINQLLQQALTLRASDIHIEPKKEYCSVRMRVDGVLKTFYATLPYPAEQIVARLKIMASLNIAEKRTPQDGQLVFGKENHAFRMSTLPILFGEKVVLRAINSSENVLNLNNIGLSNAALTTLKQSLDKPQGLILVTGATGSGKTVTLYSGLRYLNDDTRNICSIEDPVEQPIDGINQTQVNEKAKLTFSNTLRALLRQDPDVMMIGEIRDKETAMIAIEAAQTGHLVLSTLHTNSTIETLTRLQQMGIEHYHLISSITLILSQRLVRKLCPHCREKAASTYFAEYHTKQHHQHFYAKSCEKCLGGYLGRIGVFEILPMTEPIKNALLQNESKETLLTIAQNQGMQTLFEQAFSLLEEGITSLDELHRVLGLTKYDDIS